jgi:hypothetical protein
MTILLVNGGGNTPQGLARNRNFLERLGISPLGAHQVMNAQIITSPEDRARIADIVAQALDNSMLGFKPLTKAQIIESGNER